MRTVGGTRGPGGVAPAGVGCRRHSRPSAARSKATKKPSPVPLTSSPRWFANADRSSRSCHSSRSPRVIADQPDEVGGGHDVGEHECPGHPPSRMGRLIRAPSPGARPREPGPVSPRAARTRCGRAQIPASALRSPAAASASAYRRRARALSYGSSVSCQMRQDRPRSGDASVGRSSPRNSSPRAVSAPASNTGRWKSVAIDSSSIDRGPAVSRSPAARAMSIWAGSNRARVARSAAPSPLVVTASARSIERLASSISPRARSGARSRAARRVRTRTHGRRLRPAASRSPIRRRTPPTSSLGVAHGIQGPETLQFCAGLACLLLGFGPVAVESS